MAAGDEMSADRRTVNALYSDNRLKLGVFGANVSNGWAATTAPGHLVMNWPNSRDIVTMADRAGFEAVVPVARWKGFGGPTNFNGTCFETLAWAAGMGGLTEMRRIGREDFSREFQVWTSCRVVCRPTEKEAKEYAHYYVYEKGDFGAVETIIGEQGRKDPNLAQEVYERMKVRLAAGWGGYPLVGTAEQIVEEVDALTRAGLDGVVLSWVNYQDEMRQWIAEVMPLVEQAGLRKPRKSL
jgi:alkanesulfonate monooxygenase SsuD/methylene tetrahydromethanopterin reductase-like flavin-dependent oxidoreductase (luciferase family)